VVVVPCGGGSPPFRMMHVTMVSSRPRQPWWVVDSDGVRIWPLLLSVVVPRLRLVYTSLECCNEIRTPISQRALLFEFSWYNCKKRIHFFIKARLSKKMPPLGGQAPPQSRPKQARSARPICIAVLLLCVLMLDQVAAAAAATVRLTAHDAPKLLLAGVGGIH
jgi:hypothetical protein